MHDNLLLIDGSSLLSCCFFGNLPREYRFAKTDEEKINILKNYVNHLKASLLMVSLQ